MNLSLATPDSDVALWLNQQTEKSLLRFLTCGSVDDGKSTLIGRLLYDSQLILDDQLASLKKESRNRTTGEEGIDFSLLVDGLAAEREQGITIDVAYRFFSTDKRKFIVADTPGHEQYTRNMATGASNADLALVLIDARKGVLTQTRRHSFILSLIGVKHVVLVVNKIDLVDYDQAVFDRIVAEYRAFAEPRRWSPISKALRWQKTAAPGRCGSQCSGSIGPISTSAAFPARSPRAPWPWATKCSSPRRANPPWSAASSPWMANCSAPWPGRR
jgi:small GTP-binding protein